jgi:hypothetical protein
MNRKLFILVSFLQSFVLAPQLLCAQGLGPYLSNFGEPVGGAVFYGSNAWVAQSFETGAASDGYILSAPTGIGGSGAFSSELYFYSDNNGTPGNSLGGIGITLSPSTIYWFVATASTPIQTTGFPSLYWNYASDNNYSSEDNWSLQPTFALSSDGVNWTPDTSHSPFLVSINAMPAPEPSCFALAGLALAGILFFRRKSAFISAANP